MKILQQNSGLLTNSEVLQVLSDRGCDGTHPSARSLACEKMVFQHLQQHSAGSLGEQQLKAFVLDVQPFNLTRIEVLQLINLTPASVVEVHLIVEGCEERLSEEEIEKLLQVVARHLPKPLSEQAT